MLNYNIYFIKIARCVAPAFSACINAAVIENIYIYFGRVYTDSHVALYIPTTNRKHAQHIARVAFVLLSVCTRSIQIREISRKEFQNIERTTGQYKHFVREMNKPETNNAPSIKL